MSFKPESAVPLLHEHADPRGKARLLPSGLEPRRKTSRLIAAERTDRSTDDAMPVQSGHRPPDLPTRCMPWARDASGSARPSVSIDAVPCDRSVGHGPGETPSPRGFLNPPDASAHLRSVPPSA